jgi:effector-binding domain-containing protein
MKIEIKKVKEYQAAFIFHKGSYEKIPELLGKVVGFLMEQKLQIELPVYGAYFNSPPRSATRGTGMGSWSSIPWRFGTRR